MPNVCVRRGFERTEKAGGGGGDPYLHAVVGGGGPRWGLRSVGSFFEDRFGEVIPRRFAGRSHVVRAAGLGKCVSAVISIVHVSQDFCCGGGDVRGPSWCADLIANDFQFFTFVGERKNGKEKISPSA